MKNKETRNVPIQAYNIEKDTITIYGNALECCIRLSLDNCTIYSRLKNNSFKPYKGYLFKYITDKREFIVEQPKVMDDNAKRRVLDKVKAKHIVTGEELLFDTLRQCANTLKISYSTIYKRLDIKDQSPRYDYIFKWENDTTEWRSFTAEEVDFYVNNKNGLKEYIGDHEEYIKKCIGYNPKTGVLWWKEIGRNSGPVKVGDLITTKDNRGYIKLHVNNRLYYGHRIAWFLYYGEWPKYTIDHIDRVKYNNRINNLRDVSQAENNDNIPNKKERKILFNGKWVCVIDVKGIKYYLGSYVTEQEAVIAMHLGRLKYQPGYKGSLNKILKYRGFEIDDLDILVANIANTIDGIIQEGNENILVTRGKGYHVLPNGKYRCGLYIYGDYVDLGIYDDERDAVAAIHLGRKKHKVGYNTTLEQALKKAGY